MDDSTDDAINSFDLIEPHAKSSWHSVWVINVDVCVYGKATKFDSMNSDETFLLIRSPFTRGFSHIGAY